MPAIETVNTAAGAFVAGLATSLHCAGMCGPVACSLMALRNGEDEQMQAAALYHTGRLVSYTLLGIIAGSLGRWPLEKLTGSPVMFLPWLLAVILLGIALGLHVRLPRPAFLRKWSARTRLRLVRIPVRQGALALGLATPLMPCGPLYIMAGIALVSGSALRGAEFMLAFALGTVPLLWFAQQRFHVWQHQLSPAAMGRVRRGVALAGALLVFARLWPTLPANAAPPPTDGKAPAAACPFCDAPDKNRTDHAPAAIPDTTP
jgi:sulfite exporter TauE/SafE